MSKQIIIIFVLFSTINLLYSQEETKQHPILTDRFQGEGGVFFPSKTVKIGANGSTPNDEINFGESFNFNNNEVTPFFNFEWKFSKNRKWKLATEYFSIRNAHKAELKEDLEFDNITFQKGTNIRGGFGVNMIRIFFGRSFSRGLKHEFGAGLGIHGLNTSAFIAGDVLTSEGDKKFERKSVSAIIPLPNIGAWYYYTPNTKWALIARLDWFGLTIGDYSGGLWNVAPGVKYQISRHFGVGVDYRYFLLRANVNKSDWDGKFNMIFQGPLVVVHANF